MKELLLILEIIFFIALILMRTRKYVLEWIISAAILTVSFILVFVIYQIMPANEVEDLITENNTITKQNDYLEKRQNYSELKIDSLKKQIEKIENECEKKNDIYLPNR